MKKFFLPLLVIAFFTGCASQRTLTWTKKGTIPPGSRIAIIVPPDGFFLDEKYPGSGAEVASKLRNALVPDFPDTSTVNNSAGFPYVIKLELTHFENRATEWSGLPDRVTITLPLYATDTGKLVSSAVLTARSSTWTIGGDQPQDLVDLPFGVYAAKLAGKPRPNSHVIEKE